MGNGNVTVTYNRDVGGPSFECRLDGSTRKTSDQSDLGEGSQGRQQPWKIKALNFCRHKINITLSRPYMDSLVIHVYCVHILYRKATFLCA